MKKPNPSRSIRTSAVHAALLLAGLWILSGCASTRVAIAGNGKPWDLKENKYVSFKVAASLNEQSNAGVLCLELGQYEDAARCFENAIAADPKDHRSHFGLGAACESMGQKDKALRHYQAAVDLAPAEKTYRRECYRLRSAGEPSAMASAGSSEAGR